MGRPRKSKQAKVVDEDELICAVLSAGGTFSEASQVVAHADHTLIFHRMHKEPAFNEKVMRARALGLEVRKMMLADSLHVAVNKVVNDPRYTILAIFLSKAYLKLSDLPEDGKPQEGSLKDFLRELVQRKRQLAIMEKANAGNEFSQTPAKGTVTVETPNHKTNALSRNTIEN